MLEAVCRNASRSKWIAFLNLEPAAAGLPDTAALRPPFTRQGPPSRPVFFLLPPSLFSFASVDGSFAHRLLRHRGTRLRQPRRAPGIARLQRGFSRHPARPSQRPPAQTSTVSGQSARDRKTVARPPARSRLE